MKEPNAAQPLPRLEGFRERAIREANRYGHDPWIFVRELLQNARDAGATQIEFLYKESDQQSKLHCIDNGEGMAFDHAKRYLFSLYTSSKEGSKDKAGRFGVGFWSILRFGPSAIIIRSKPRGAKLSQGWGLALDGMLRKARSLPPAHQSGTEIVLSRPRRQQGEAQRLLEAVRDHGRFLTQRDNPERALDILVNGVRINEPFALPEPSISFQARGIRGVIALAPAGKVELFSRGLRVRSAATLDDLVSSQPTASSLPDGLRVAPQILLDCDDIQVLLHRSDVRENADLKRALALTRKHLRRLVEAQLAGVRAPGFLEIFASFGQWMRERSAPFYLASSAAALCAVSLGAWTAIETPRSSISATPQSLSLGTMRRQYQGPTVHQIEGGSPALFSFEYSPAQLKLHFRQFSLSNLDTLRPEPSPKLSTYKGPSCEKKSDCVTVQIKLDGDEHIKLGSRLAINLPEASGYRIDPKSLSLLQKTQTQALGNLLFQDQHGDPWIYSSQALSGELQYKMGKSSAPRDKAASARVLDAAYRAWKPKERMEWQDAEDHVAQAIRYSVEESTAKAHQRAISQDKSVFARGLGIEAGDCDVQNTVLAALLRDQGYQARLALGHVGVQGKLQPIAHAWTEFRKSRRDPWSVADASTVYPPAGPELASQGPEQNLDTENPSDAQEASQDPEQSYTGWIWVGSGLFSLLFGVLLYRHSRAPAGSVDKSQKRLTDLLLSALQNPNAFSGIPGIFRRPVVSRLGQGPVSLRDLKSSHRLGRLWRASHTHALAKRALASGDDILDMHCPMARAIASHLQLPDLDQWQLLWESRRADSPALSAIDAQLKYLCVSLTLLVCSEVQGEPQALHLGPRPLIPKLLDRSRLEVPSACLVAYPPNHPLMTALKEQDSPWARYALIKDALTRIAMDESLRASIHGFFATQAYAETVR